MIFICIFGYDGSAWIAGVESLQVYRIVDDCDAFLLTDAVGPELDS